MRAGALREQLQFQRKVQVGVTSLNAPNFEWVDWNDPIWCESSVRRGREIFDSETRQRFGEDIWRFRVRYVEIIGASTAMRIVFDGQNFDILSIMPDRQKRGDSIIECSIQDFRLETDPLSLDIFVAIPDGENGQVYDGFTVTASGGTSPYTHSVASGALPSGLALAASTGAVSGTPTASGTFAVTFQVEDASGAAAVLPSISFVIT